MLKLTDFHKVERNTNKGRQCSAIRMAINRHKYITFSLACIQALGNRERYEIYINDECTMILLKADDRGPSRKSEKGCLCFGRKALAEKIIKKYSPTNDTPSFLGHYEFNLDGVLFDLRHVERQEDDNE